MSDYISPEAQARHAQAVAAYALSEQKRSQSNAIRFVLNFPILIAVLYALNTVGFITVTASSTVGLTGLLTTIAVIALIFMLIRKLAGYAYGTFILFTCCTGILSPSAQAEGFLMLKSPYPISTEVLYNAR